MSRTYEDGEKSQCPECAKNGKDSSHDNLHHYGDGMGAYCWACNYTIPSEDFKDGSLGRLKTKGDKKLILQKDIDNFTSKALTSEQVTEVENKTVSKCPKLYRGIPTNIYESLGVRWEVNGESLSMYYPITVIEGGNERIVGYKVRKHPKDFAAIGYVGKLGGFLNQKNSIADTLIICGGEVDLATIVHAMESDKYRKSYNVVSSPIGEKTTASFIKLNYDWVDSHKKIICALDMDEDGEASFGDVKAIVDNSKLYKASMRYKDANEYLKNNDMANLIADVYWNAQPIKSYGIIGSGDIINKIMGSVSSERIPLPPFLNALKKVLIGGIPLEEVVNIISSVSTGKSVFINEIILFWIQNSPHKVFVISLEDGVGSYGAKMMSRVSGKKILALETVEERQKAVKEATPEFMKYLIDEDGSHKFNILEDIPSTTEGLKESILQAVRVHGAKIILIDPLQSVLGTASLEEQNDFMNFQESARKKYKITFINVCHTRKSPQGGVAHSQGGKIVEEDTKGSSQIAATSTIAMILMRDKMNEDPIVKNTTIIDIPKNRTIGETGENLAKVYYSPAHHTLFDFDYAEKNNFFMGVSSEDLLKTINPDLSMPVTPDVQDELDESMGVF